MRAWTLMKGGENPEFESVDEGVAFAMAFQRLCSPGSGLQGLSWAETMRKQKDGHIRPAEKPGVVGPEPKPRCVGLPAD